MKRLGFLGPEGTFSQQAALEYTSNSPAELVALSSIREILLAVQGGKLDLGLIPLENSLEGSINEALDIMAWEVNLFIQGELILPIAQSLMVNPDAQWQDLKKVFTHPQSAGQCRRFLETNLPQAEVRLTYSNAEGAKQAKENGIAAGAIGPEWAAEIFGLQVVLKNIQDAATNCTKFVVIGQGLPAPTGCDKTSIVFTTEHKPGSLYRILDIFSLWDINLTKIESRPSREKLGRYIFFIDLEGHFADDGVQDALTMVKRKTTFYKFLGSYPRAGISLLEV